MNDLTDLILFSGWMTGSSCPACGLMWLSALSTTTSSGYGDPSSWRTGSHTTFRLLSPPTTSSRHFSVSGFSGKPQGFGWQVQILDLKSTCLFYVSFSGKYNWLCQPVDFSYTQDGFDAADMTWWYFFSKYVDFFDSFFFLARKKFSHLSTLHVVHHCIMPFTSWFGIR